LFFTGLIYLRCEEGTEHLKKYTKVTSSDPEMLTSMIGAKILKMNNIWRTDTVEDVETAQ